MMIMVTVVVVAMLVAIIMKIKILAGVVTMTKTTKIIMLGGNADKYTRLLFTNNIKIRAQFF